MATKHHSTAVSRRNVGGRPPALKPDLPIRFDFVYALSSLMKIAPTLKRGSSAFDY